MSGLRLSRKEFAMRLAERVLVVVMFAVAVPAALIAYELWTYMPSVAWSMLVLTVLATIAAVGLLCYIVPEARSRRKAWLATHVSTVD